MRQALGDGYTEACPQTYHGRARVRDFVMYWWNHAAELARPGKVRRFGFVTTNSLRQTFNRRVLEKHLEAKKPLSLLRHPRSPLGRRRRRRRRTHRHDRGAGGAEPGSGRPSAETVIGAQRA